jgi:hypothetical protein
MKANLIPINLGIYSLGHKSGKFDISISMVERVRFMQILPFPKEVPYSISY